MIFRKSVWGGRRNRICASYGGNAVSAQQRQRLFREGWQGFRASVVFLWGRIQPVKWLVRVCQRSSRTRLCFRVGSREVTAFQKATLLCAPFACTSVHRERTPPSRLFAGPTAFEKAVPPCARSRAPAFIENAPPPSRWFAGATAFLKAVPLCAFACASVY